MVHYGTTRARMLQPRWSCLNFSTNLACRRAHEVGIPQDGYSVQEGHDQARYWRRRTYYVGSEAFKANSERNAIVNRAATLGPGTARRGRRTHCCPGYILSELLELCTYYVPCYLFSKFRGGRLLCVLWSVRGLDGDA